VFVDVILVSAVLYIINFANCYHNGHKTARKEGEEGREGKESNHNRKEEGNCAETSELRSCDPSR
jgi:hypothetical protein